ncbi:hypothetical protein LCGC14_2299860, partial [marine sediment metagenome]
MRGPAGHLADRDGDAPASGRDGWGHAPTCVRTVRAHTANRLDNYPAAKAG